MKHTCILLLLLMFSTASIARDHVIYSIAQDIPMGEENEVIKKNYYLNIGENQGVQQGITVNVYRVISNVNPYNDKKRINHKVKVGELEVLHSEDEASIAILKSFKNSPQDPLFELGDFMIGDHIEVKTN